MGPGGVFSDALQSITTTKLRELSNKRTSFENLKSLLLLETQQNSNQRERVRRLIEGVKQGFAITKTITKSPLEVKLDNLERFLAQSQHDPSISTKLLKDWELSLMQTLNVQTLKYQYASLYGELVTEWLSAEHAAVPDNVSEESEVFEQTSRKAKVAQRAEWESYVFGSFETNQDATKKYLLELFGKDTNEQAFMALETLRANVNAHEASLVTEQFNITTLKWVIEGLLGSDLLADDKRAELKDFVGNPVILSEVADVLNMRMAALEKWDWEGDVVVDQRRHLSGKYKIYMQEDVLQAIFLQYIGVQWSVFFKRALISFAKADGAWTSSTKAIPKIDRLRREYYLGYQKESKSIQSRRHTIYMADYFLSKLLDFQSQDISVKDGDESYDLNFRAYGPMQGFRGVEKKDAGYSKNEIIPAYSINSDEISGRQGTKPRPKNPMKLKQQLLHLLSTEILINTELYGELTCVRSEFLDWEQSLPHSTIALVLTFFGVSKKWLDFFVKFLQAPLKFLHDGSAARAHNQKRGVPESHIISDVFGEVVLFCLDFSVNQVTGGGQLYRMHEEFWFWSSSHEECIKAWQVAQTFGQAMGVSLSSSKSGSERIGRDKEELPTRDPILPDGEIRWGFLLLDPEAGRFNIDQEVVDIHIKELQLQLQDKAKSILSWAKAWNTYAGTFFTTNFGTPANCYGQEHVDEVLTTLERIQRSIFPKDGGVVQYLKAVIQDRFHVSDLPDGYLYFPNDFGGLELHNSFIPLLLIRDVVYESPIDAVRQKFPAAELEAYRRAKTVYESGRTPRQCREDPKFEPDDKDTFMPFEEFTRYREESGYHYTGDLHDVFVDLLEKPTEEKIGLSPPADAALGDLHDAPASGGIGTWHTMTPYWRWVVQLYGPEIIERFGGLSIVDRGLLPIGMVNLFRSGRVQWQG